MGILSDQDIRFMLGPTDDSPGPWLVIDPPPQIIQPTSVDLHLGDRFLYPIPGIIDPVLNVLPDYREEQVNAQTLAPGDFVLGATLEWIEIPPGLVGILAGKSSLARFGLQIESAGIVDPGWRGRLTLEIVNLGKNTIILRPGMLICQIRFEALNMNACEHLYGDPAVHSHYQMSDGPRSGVGLGLAYPESVSPAEPAASVQA